MQYKPNQRVAYYQVTGKSEPCAAKVDVGSILVDRPRGEITSWDFMNLRTGETSWVAGERIGFARVDPETLQPVPEPGLQAALDRIRESAALEARSES